MAGSVRDVRVAVHPGARREYIKEGKRDSFDVAVKEPAEGNRANARVCELTAAHYGVPLKKVRIVAGHKRPRKRLRVELPAPLEAP